MSKVIYEFYYVVGSCCFNNCYECIVDKETDKMLYGDVFKGGVKYGTRFAINKTNLNQLHVSTDHKKGLVYRVQIDCDNRKNAEKQAWKIIYDHMMNFIEILQTYTEDEL